MVDFRMQGKRWKAAALHLGISAVIAGITALLILKLWYPSPFDELSGGFFLLAMICSVDLTLGPLMTLIVFNPVKPRSELIRDLTVIGILQIVGLAYGVHTVYLARPVALVFERNVFKVINQVDVAENELAEADPTLRSLSLTGPVFLGTRRAKVDEKLDAVLEALAGNDISARPKFWTSYDSVREQVIDKAKPLSFLLKNKKRIADIQKVANSVNIPIEQLVYLPLVSKKALWTVVLDKKHADPKAYLPYYDD